VPLPVANVTMHVTEEWLVQVRADAVALFVALTTTTQGNFAENYFFLEKGMIRSAFSVSFYFPRVLFLFIYFLLYFLFNFLFIFYLFIIYFYLRVILCRFNV
jgi:hypothetical protein